MSQTRSFAAICLATMSVGFVAVKSHGQCECSTIQDETLVPPGLDAADQFGSSVAIDGDVLIGGAPQGPGLQSGITSGVGWLYRFDGYDWIEETQVEPGDPAPGDRFGDAVSLEGDVVLVGAPRKNFNAQLVEAGAAYVFRFDGTSWQPEQQLLADPIERGARFGSAVAVQGNLAVVGAPLEGSNSGSVYVFEKSGSTWSLQQKLVAAGGGTNDFFGRAVAIDGDVIVVGGVFVVSEPVDTGTVWVFRHNGTQWIEETTLVPPGLAVEDGYGYSVDIEGDVVVAGAPFDETAAGGVAAGSIHVFRHDGTAWDFEQTLQSCDDPSGANLGTSVSIGEPYILGGAPLDDLSAGGNQGSAYVFKSTPAGWIHQAKLNGSGVEIQSGFGRSVSIGRGLAAVGVWKDDEGLHDDAGTVRAFHGLGECDCCHADVTDDGTVGPADLAEVLANWGACAGCPADINNDGEVGPPDLGAVLAAWNCTCGGGGADLAGGEDGDSSNPLDGASLDVIILLLGWPDVESFIAWLGTAEDAAVQAIGEQLQSILGP